MDPEALVTEAEAAYQTQDADRIMALFDPEIVVYWNGRKQWDSLEPLRAEHAEFIASFPEYEIRKTLRAAAGETITVEWTDRWVDADGNRGRGSGAEFWTMRDERLREWHAYYEEHDLEADAESAAFLEFDPMRDR